MTATQKLRANVRRQISRMEQRGYFIDTQIKEKLKSAKYQTLKSYQRNRYSKLYGESTALSDRGKIVSGSEYRQYERSEAAKKSAVTRRERKSVSERQYHSQDYYDEWERQEEFEREWEQQRRRQDKEDRMKAMQYQEGEIAFNEIQNLINQYPTKGAKSLERSLNNEIRKYGKENVLIAIGQSPQDAIESAKSIIFYEEDADAIHGAFLDFYELITGTIPTDTEAKELGDTLDAMTDFESR